MRHTQNLVFVALLIGVTLLASGCFSRDTTIEVTYVSELSPDKLANGESITVAEFVDDRSEIGIAAAKNPIGNIAVRYNAKTPVGKLVRDTLAEAFRDAGFEVETMGFWDLDPAKLRNVATMLAMGGKITVFWAENRPDPGGLGGSGFASVRILFVLANPENEEIVWQGQIEGGVTRHSVWGTPNLKEMLDQAFSETIDRLLSSPEFRNAVSRAIEN